MTKHNHNHKHESKGEPQEVLAGKENEALHDSGEKNGQARDAVAGNALDQADAAAEACNDSAQLLEKKNQEIDSLKDLLKRRQADFENYKKRMQKVQEDDRRRAIKELALDIIGINDDLLRAIDAASSLSTNSTADNGSHHLFIDGVRMISRQIEDSLKKYGIEEIDSLNMEFDPNCHEAVEIDTSESVDRDTVTRIYQKGFRQDDYIIRCPRVRVSKPARPAMETPPLSENDGDKKQEHAAAQ